MSVRNWFEPIIEPCSLRSAQQVHAPDLERLVARDHADDRRRAADVEHPERLLGRRLGADRLEAVVDAAAGELAHRADDVVDLAGVDGLGGAERLRPTSSLSLADVDGDHLPAPAMRAAWMAARPMPPAPMTATVLPGSTWAVRNTAPVPVSTPQPIERGPVERDVLGDLHDGPLVHEHLLGEAAEAGELARSACRRRASAAAACSPGPAEAVGVEHAVRVAGQALTALAAEHRQAAHDVVAGLHVGDALADLARRRRPTRGRAPPAPSCGTCPP